MRNSRRRATLCGTGLVVSGALGAVLAFAAAHAASQEAGTPPLEIDWRSSPLDLNLRGLNGERFRFRCPPGKPVPGQVLGSGPYTDGSSICAAAVHAGVIRASTGGAVTIEVRPGQSHYAASLSHYIQSQPYEPYWSGSFLIVTEATPQPPQAAAPNKS